MERQIVRWTPEEDEALISSIKTRKNLYKQIETYADTAKRSKSACVARYYYLIRRDPALAEPKKKEITVRAKRRRFTVQEDNTILRYVKAYPQNLSYCFMTVAEQLGRTTTSVTKHWYNTLSKQPDAKAFVLASESSVVINGKCKPGIDSTPSIWKKIINIINRLLS